jgi:hypothetical protein
MSCALEGAPVHLAMRRVNTDVDCNKSLFGSLKRCPNGCFPPIAAVRLGRRSRPRNAEKHGLLANRN